MSQQPRIQLRVRVGGDRRRVADRTWPARRRRGFVVESQSRLVGTRPGAVHRGDEPLGDGRGHDHVVATVERPDGHIHQISRPRATRRRHRGTGREDASRGCVQRAGSSHAMTCHVEPRRVQRQPPLQEFDERRDFVGSPAATRLWGNHDELRQRVDGVTLLQRYWWGARRAFADEVRDVRPALAGAVQVQEQRPRALPSWFVQQRCVGLRVFDLL